MPMCDHFLVSRRSTLNITMMKTIVAASLVASAAAFAPSQQTSKSTAVAGAFDKELGVQEPLGFW
jgi:hypothetical protein